MKCCIPSTLAYENRPRAEVEVPRCAEKQPETSLLQYRGHFTVPGNRRGLLNSCKISLNEHWLPQIEASEEEETPKMLCCSVPTSHWPLTATLNTARYSILVKLPTLIIHVQETDRMCLSEHELYKVSFILCLKQKLCFQNTLENFYIFSAP